MNEIEIVRKQAADAGFILEWEDGWWSLMKCRSPHTREFTVARAEILGKIEYFLLGWAAAQKVANQPVGHGGQNN